MYANSDSLPAHSRIWIYQCSRELSNDEAEAIGAGTQQFLENWTSHNQALKASYELRYNRFLILMIDEKVAGAGGCSIDKSVHFVQALEKQYKVSFFDRLSFAYKIKDRVEVVSRPQFEDLISRGILNDDTIVFNNLVSTTKELESGWEIPLKESWHKGLVKT